METFGQMLRRKRIEKGIPASHLADRCGVVHGFIWRLEKGRRLPPRGAVLKTLADTLCATEQEKEQFYDLAALPRNEVPDDILQYLMENKSMWETIRALKRKSREDC